MSELMRRIVSVNADLSRPLQRKEIGQLLATGDERADRFVVLVSNAGNQVDLTGCTAKGYFIRPDKATVQIDGSIDTASNTITVDLSKPCYVWGGCFTLSIKIEREGETLTLCIYDGYLKQTSTGVYAGSGDTVVSLEYVLQKVAEAEALAAEAKTAVDSTAPGITATANGSVVIITDAAARPAKSVLSSFSSYSDGSGTPAPDNVIPVVKPPVRLYHETEYGENAQWSYEARIPDKAYGGVLDWVSGRVSMSIMSYVPSGADITNFGIASTGCPYVQIVLPERWSGAYAFCTHYPSVSGASTRAAVRLVAPVSCYIYDPRFTDRSVAAALLDAEKPMILYELETPKTLQTEPVTVNLYEGENALWADEGAVNVEYIVDTQTYVDTHAYVLPVASADTLGGVKVGEGLQMTGDALGVKPEGVYELIEAITLHEEDTDAIIVRTKEPNGETYNYKKIYIIAMFPQASKSDDKWPRITTHKGTSLQTSWAGCISASQDRIAYLQCEILESGVMTIESNVAALSPSNSYTAQNGHKFVLKVDPTDTVFEFYLWNATTSPTPAGTKIEIWGVRANA